MIAFTLSQLLCCSTLFPAQYPVTTTLQPGELRIRSATTASNLLASSLNLTEFLAKLTLGNAPNKAEQSCFLDPQPSQVESGHGTGHLPIPSASTGWQYVGVISSLSLQSGPPSPSVSRVTPCVSTGQPSGVCSWSNWSVTPSRSLSGSTGFGKRIKRGLRISLYASYKGLSDPSG